MIQGLQLKVSYYHLDRLSSVGTIQVKIEFYEHLNTFRLTSGVEGRLMKQSG